MRARDGVLCSILCWRPCRGLARVLGLALRRGQLGMPGGPTGIMATHWEVVLGKRGVCGPARSPGVMSLTAQVQRGCGVGAGRDLGQRGMLPRGVVFGGP